MPPPAALLALLLAGAAAAPGRQAARPGPAPAIPAASSAGRWLPPEELAGRCAGLPAEGRGRVAVYLPRGTPGPGGWPLAIALHGWGHRPDHWRALGLAELADRHGVAVVLPEMGTSVYEHRLYPETRRAWGSLPGACWIGDVVLPWARRTLPVSAAPRRTAILGYSTGGRGALVVAGRYPEFAFAGSLSGTFDLARLRPSDGEYAIHAEVFGPRAGQTDRWRDEDIGPLLPGLARTAIFAAQGAVDGVLRPDQLEVLAVAKGRGSPAVRLVEVAGAGHDERFWRGELPELFLALAAALDLAPAPAPG